MDKGALDQLLSHAEGPAAGEAQKAAAQSRSASGADDDSRTLGRKGAVTVQMLRDHFHLPLHTVAKKFGMCTTAFKKMCRRLEIPKWPHRQLRGIDKKIAALKTELNYATNADRQQFMAGLSSLETEKTRLAQGIFTSIADGTNDSGSDSRSRSPNTDAEADTTPPPTAPVDSLPVGDGDGDTDSDGTIDDEPSRAGDADLQQVSSVVVTEKELREHFHLPLHTVAKKFGMCTTAFKKLCRRFAIAKWPHRQLRGIDKKIAALRAALNYSTGDKDACWANLRKLEEEKARIARTDASTDGADGAGGATAGSLAALGGGALVGGKGPAVKEEGGSAGAGRTGSRADISNLLCDDEEDEEEDEGDGDVGMEGGEGKGGEEGAWLGGAITEELLREHFHLPLQVVARKFGMCTTAFKKLCRRFAIAKWPHRQLRGIDKKIAALRAALNYSTGDRHTCQRSILALEEEKARLTQAALGDKPSPLSTAASPRTQPPTARSAVPPLGTEAVSPGAKRRRAEEGGARRDAWGEKRVRGEGGEERASGEGEGKAGDAVDRLRSLAAIEMLVSVATSGALKVSDDALHDRARPGAGWRPQGPAVGAGLPGVEGGGLSRPPPGLPLGLGGATPFNTPPLDPVSPLLPVPLSAAAHVPPLCASAPLPPRHPVLPLQWSSPLGPLSPPGLPGLAHPPAGLLTGSPLTLPQPSWGIAASGRGHLL